MQRATLERRISLEKHDDEGRARLEMELQDLVKEEFDIENTVLEWNRSSLNFYSNKDNILYCFFITSLLAYNQIKERSERMHIFITILILDPFLIWHYMQCQIQIDIKIIFINYMRTCIPVLKYPLPTNPRPDTDKQDLAGRHYGQNPDWRRLWLLQDFGGGFQSSVLPGTKAQPGVLQPAHTGDPVLHGSC